MCIAQTKRTNVFDISQVDLSWIYAIVNTLNWQV